RVSFDLDLTAVGDESGRASVANRRKGVGSLLDGIAATLREVGGGKRVESGRNRRAVQVDVAAIDDPRESRVYGKGILAEHPRVRVRLSNRIRSRHRECVCGD